MPVALNLRPVVWLALSAWALPGLAVEPYPPTQPDAVIELPRAVTWHSPTVIGGGWDGYLAPGTYRAVLEDDKGVYYAGPSPCAWSSPGSSDPTRRTGQAWMCTILMPKSRQESPRVMVVHAGFWLQTAYLPDGSPDRDRIGEAKNGAPVVGTPAVLAIKGAKAPPEEVAKFAATQGVANAVGGAVLAGSAGAVAGGLGALIGAGIIAVMENAKRGSLEEMRAPPPAGWYKASGAVWRARAEPPRPSGEAPAAPAPAEAPEAPAVVAVAAVPSRPAVPLPDTPAESLTDGRKVTERPANALPLTAADLDGHAWRFAHPSNPAQFGEVRIAFRGGVATARNAKGGSTGPYDVENDRLCVRFETHNWGTACYYLVDAQGPHVLVVVNGRLRPLSIE